MYTLINMIFDAKSRRSNLIHLITRQFYRGDKFMMVTKVAGAYYQDLINSRREPDVYSAEILRMLGTAYLLLGRIDERIEVEKTIQNLPAGCSDELSIALSLDREAFARLINGNVRKVLQQAKAVERKLNSQRREHASLTSVCVKQNPDVDDINDSQISYAMQSNFLTCGYGHELLFEYKESLDYYSRALLLSRRVAGHRSLQSAIFMALSAQVMVKLGDLDEALSLIETAISIRERFLRRDSMLLGCSYLNRARVHLALGNLDLASQDLKRCSRIYKKIEREGGFVDMPYLLESQADLAFGRGQIDLCLELTTKAMDGYSQYFSSWHPVLLPVLDLRARCFEAQRRVSEGQSMRDKYDAIVVHNKMRKAAAKRRSEVRIS